MTDDSAPTPTSSPTPGADRAIRSAAERRALVEHVRDTPQLQETDWLEHKVGYDLTRNPGRVAVAKQLIGFANRRPAVAARHSDGYAYLLLGVEPSACPGVSVHDSADIETWLRPFVGADLHFDVQYVAAGGAQVLMLVVDPPQPGDAIHCLRKSSQDPDTGHTVAAGTVFVRHPGKTQPAMPDDIDALTERARRQEPRLQLHVRAAGPVSTTPRSELTDAARAIAVRDEREALLGQLPQTALQAASRPVGEKRTQAEYIAEVERYCADLEARWPLAVATRAAEENLAWLELTLVNDSDRNFEDTVVELTIPLARDQVHTTLDSAWERLTPPEAPDGWGQTDLIVVPSPAPVTWEDLSITIEPRGLTETFVEFPPMRARPHTPHPLPRVLLFVSPNDPAPLRIAWRATSASTSGELSGEVAVPVVEQD